MIHLLSLHSLCRLRPAWFGLMEGLSPRGAIGLAPGLLLMSHRHATLIIVSDHPQKQLIFFLFVPHFIAPSLPQRRLALAKIIDDPREWLRCAQLYAQSQFQFFRF